MIRRGILVGYFKVLIQFKFYLKKNNIIPDPIAITSSTQIFSTKTVPKGKSVRVVLAETIKGSSYSGQGYSKAVKRIPWDKISIDGYNTDELQNELKEIVKVVSHVRTLDEILAEYVKNRHRYDLNAHPEFPSKPISAHWLYFKENREKITKLAEQANGGKAVPYVSLT